MGPLLFYKVSFIETIVNELPQLCLHFNIRNYYCPTKIRQ